MKRLLLCLLALAAIPATADSGSLSDARIDVQMTNRGASTFYVDIDINGAGSRQFLVDTGSSYTTINEAVLAQLRAAGQVEYVKDLEGILADGTKQVVPVYRIDSLTVGGRCTMHGVQAAVFPGTTRNILGLSALRSAAPFVFSIDPPVLSMSNCTAPAPAAGGRLASGG